MPMPRIVRRVLVILLAAATVVVVLAALLLGPTAIFWARWLTPRTALPAVAIDDVVSAAQPGLAPELEMAFRAALADVRDDTSLPAISAAVGRDGSVVWAGTRGYADVEQGVIAQTDDMFRLGSVSKPITGAILSRLHERGEIDLDATARALAPDLPSAYDAVTVRQLASHTAGVRHYVPRLTWRPSRQETLTTTHYDTVQAGLDKFIDDPLLFEPGTEFKYSTYGYSVLAYLVERAAGVPFAALLDAEINEPANVTVRLDDVTAEIPERVGYYLTKDGQYVRAYPTDPSYKWAGGGMIASPSDLVRLGLVLLGEAYMQPATRSLMWTPVPIRGSDTNVQNYGLGWRVDTSVRVLGEDRPTLIIHHGGRQLGGVAFWALLPEFGVSVAVVANTENRDARRAVQDVSYAIARALVLHDAEPGP